MSPFVSGALGAVTVLLVAGLVRRGLWLRRFRRGPRGGWFLRRLFRKLGTRPDQEQVLTAEAESLAGDVRALRRDAHALRSELADLLAGPSLDVAAARNALEARWSKLETVRSRAAEALARVHATLEPSQRAELAALLRRGPRRFHGAHAQHA